MCESVLWWNGKDYPWGIDIAPFKVMNPEAREFGPLGIATRSSMVVK